MSAIDIALTFILFGSVAYGLWRGVIRQVASLGGIVLGIVACRLFGAQASNLLVATFPTTFSSAVTAAVVANVLLFILVWLTVGLIARLLRKLTQALMLGWLDRLLGGVFSLFKWLLLTSIILNLWHLIAPESAIFTTSTLMDGEMLPWVMRIAPAMLGFVAGGEPAAMAANLSHTVSVC